MMMMMPCMPMRVTFGRRTKNFFSSHLFLGLFDCFASNFLKKDFGHQKPIFDIPYFGILMFMFKLKTKKEKEMFVKCNVSEVFFDPGWIFFFNSTTACLAGVKKKNSE